MTTTTFLILLSAFSVISGLTTEAIKKLANDKANLSYNIVALIVALIVGSVGCAIYYQLNNIMFTLNNVIYMVLMGFASGLVSMLGFDKVQQAIQQLTNK
jgi:O-antigen/teichoic acid export membrane protein